MLQHCLNEQFLKPKLKQIKLYEICLAFSIHYLLINLQFIKYRPEVDQLKKICIKQNISAKFFLSLQLQYLLLYYMKQLLVAGQYTYYLQDYLGKGAWGSVYKAKNKQNKIVALKKMNKFQIQSSSQNYSKLQNQIRLLQQVKQSSQIIKFIDVFRTESNYYIITQYIEASEDLYKYMQRNKIVFNQLQCIGLWKKLIKGVDYLHKKGIMHRDLKLQNLIYVQKTNQIKIIDFGLAVTLESKDDNKTCDGTPVFMSPQVLKKQKYTYKCDIWSLGIIFYFMIFGKSPYGNPKTTKEIQNKMELIKKNQVNFENQILSQQCLQIILACLSYQQQDRPQASQLLEFQFFNPESSYLQELKNIDSFWPLSGFLKENSLK